MKSCSEYWLKKVVGKYYLKRSIADTGLKLYEKKFLCSCFYTVLPTF